MWGSFEKRIAVLLLLLLFLFSALCNGHTISVKLRYDKRHVIPLTNFQFSDHVGHVSFLISSATVTSTTASQPADPSSRIGFILQPHQVRNKSRFKSEENNTICALDFKLDSVVLFSLQNLSHKSFPVINSGMQSLFFINCNNESFVTMDGRAELYNVDDTTKNYLSAGLTELPFLSFIFSFLYLCLLGFWILVCLSNRRAFSRTHLLMGGLLLINSVYFRCVAADLLYVMANGTSHHGLDGLFSVLQLTRSLFLFTMIVLIVFGWFLWKPYLYGQEMAFLTVVILLQVLANVLNPVLPWEPYVPYDDFEAIFSMVDIICCFFFICPIQASVLWLEMVCETIPSAYRNLEKLSIFNMHLVVYMFITRLIVYVLPTQWLMYAAKETTTLLFHIMMLYVFRPVDHRMGIHTADESWLPTLLSISCFDSPV